MDFWVKISLKSGFMGEISLKVIFEEIWVFEVFHDLLHASNVKTAISWTSAGAEASMKA